jgi:SAM-dependent methyltransferase
MSVFNTYARYYDLLYRDKDYAAESRFVSDLLQRHAPGGRVLLELGCGTGVHALNLAALGFEVYGVDLSPTMLEMAQQQRRRAAPELAARLGFAPGDLRTIRLDRTFDAVIALFHVLSYQVTAADLQATFATARSHLKDGGVFLCDYWYGPAVLTERPTVRVKRMEDESSRVTRIAEPLMDANANLVDVGYQIFVEDMASGRIEAFQETHRMRYLFKPEVDALFAGVGMTQVECGQWMTGGEPGFDTWNVYSVGT